ncbi:bromodomain-containing protein 7-like [Apostichopus japonicus]|uniref:bromodomain-containing protein 7-like n=1 Tax=Stichopus japonicus TaxID=307972 RepID=UPI003AB3B340
MGRKNKRQYRAEKPSSNEPPLKLVLKVGKDGASSSIAIPQELVLPPEKDLEPASTPEPVKRKRRKKRKHEAKSKESDHTSSETVEMEDPTEEEEEVAAECVKEETKETEVEEEIERVEEVAEQEATEAEKPEANISEKTPVLPLKKLLAAHHERKQSPKGGREKEVKIRGLGLDAKDPLTKVLESLHTSLGKKDVDKFFAHPVTDLIAPGYSTIIAEPMDFSTMRKKIKERKYLLIEQYQEDFTLMCNNCMTYNQPETIYFKAAKKLLAAGQKIMGKERLAAVKRAFDYTDDMESLSKQRNRTLRKKAERKPDGMEGGELSDAESMLVDEQLEEPNTSIGNPEGTDDLTDEEASGVIQEVLEAAKEARDRLTTKMANSKMGFLRREQDGTTSLNFVNPANIAHPHDRHAVNLGKLTSKLMHGAGSLPGFREDKRNKANPITYLYYGPFSSYAPKYDSTYSNLSKEESDLLYSTYGDETGQQYAQSIQGYTKDCDNYVTRMVDSLLDTLTEGEHSKVLATLKENRKTGQSSTETAPNTDTTVPSSEKANVTNSTDPSKNIQQPPPGFDLDSLKSLSDLGIDMSFLPALAKDLKEQGVPLPEEPQDVTSQLNKTSDLIQQLEKTQKERLSQKLPIHLQYVPQPSEQEYKLANKLSNRLQNLISKAKPADVVSTESVRSAMGISSHPPHYDEPLTETIEILDDDPPESGPNKELLDLLDSPQHDTKSPEVVEIS